MIMYYTYELIVVSLVKELVQTDAQTIQYLLSRCTFEESNIHKLLTIVSSFLGNLLIKSHALASRQACSNSASVAEGFPNKMFS